MANQSTWFDDPSPIKGDFNQRYHSMMKCEFPDIAALSEEENYAHAANVNKETIQHNRKQRDIIYNDHCDIHENSCHISTNNVCLNYLEIPETPNDKIPGCNISANDMNDGKICDGNELTSNINERKVTSEAIGYCNGLMDSIKTKDNKKQIQKKRRRKYFSTIKRPHSFTNGARVQPNQKSRGIGASVEENNMTEEETPKKMEKERPTERRVFNLGEATKNFASSFEKCNVLASSDFIRPSDISTSVLAIKQTGVGRSSRRQKGGNQTFIVDNSHEKTKLNILKKCKTKKTVNPLSFKESLSKTNEKAFDVISAATEDDSLANTNIPKFSCDEMIPSSCNSIASDNDKQCNENDLTCNLPERKDTSNEVIDYLGLKDSVPEEIKINEEGRLKKSIKGPGFFFCTKKLPYSFTNTNHIKSSGIGTSMKDMNEEERWRSNKTNINSISSNESLNEPNGKPCDEIYDSTDVLDSVANINTMMNFHSPLEEIDEESPDVICGLNEEVNSKDDPCDLFSDNMYTGSKEVLINSISLDQYKLDETEALVLGKSDVLNEKVKNTRVYQGNLLTTDSNASIRKPTLVHRDENAIADGTENTLPSFSVSIPLFKLKQPKTKRYKSKKMFKCDICGKYFYSGALWIKHLQYSHSTTCAFCDEKFIDFKKYVNHVHTSHDSLPTIHVTRLHLQDFQFFLTNSLNSNKAICILCKKKCLTRETGTEHIKKSHYFEVFKWTNYGVIKKYMNTYFLKKFASAVNCPLCKIYFERENDFHLHMESYHSSHSFCLQCNTYILNRKLPQHEKKHSKEENGNTKAEIEYSCDSCQISCSSAEYFTLHSNPVQCHHCDAVLCSEKEMMIHRLEEHSDDLFGICTSCDSVFYNEPDLLEHMVKNHSSKFLGSKLSVCQLCTASSIAARYFTSTTLRSHMLSHSIISIPNTSIPLGQGTYFDIIIPNNAEVPPLECILCSHVEKVHCDGVITFICHVTEYHPDASLGFCIPCGFKSFLQSTDALVHFINEHFTYDGFQLECLTCNLYCSSSKSALLHILSNHLLLFGRIPSHLHDMLLSDNSQISLGVCERLNQSCFRCDLCSFDTSGFLSYIVHLNTRHNVLNLQIKCKLCKTTHQSISSFVKHTCKNYSNSGRQKTCNKAIVLGVDHEFRRVGSIRGELSQGKYLGISGEHSYASQVSQLNITGPANIELVHQEHSYYYYEDQNR